MKSGYVHLLCIQLRIWVFSQWNVSYVARTGSFVWTIKRKLRMLCQPVKDGLTIVFPTRYIATIRLLG